MGIIYFKDKLGVNSNVTFAVYEIVDIEYEAYRTELDLFDNTWLSKLTDPNLIAAFQSKSQKTAIRIRSGILTNSTTNLIKSAGEHIVVYLSRNLISSNLKYKEIPLPELYKDKVTGNPGFDFFNENTSIGRIFFGEGKFRSTSNNLKGYKIAYKAALAQVVKFINEKKILKNIVHFNIL